jgi:hypothetical protein
VAFRNPIGNLSQLAGRITAAQIEALAVTTEALAAGAITAEKIAADAVTAVKIAAGAITAEKIAAGAILAEKIAADAVTAVKIAAGAITAEKIAAGAITAEKIAAGTITTDKLLVGAGINAIANPGAETGLFDPHVGYGVAWTVSNGTRKSGAWAFRSDLPDRVGYSYVLTANGTRTEYAKKMPVQIGDVVRAEAWVRSGTASNANAAIYIDQLDSTGAVVTNGQYNASQPGESRVKSPLTTTWTKIVAEVTIDNASTSYVGLAIAVSNSTAGVDVLWGDDFVLTTKHGGELIVDGAITADKLSATAIDGKVITGPTIRTAADGDRLEIGATGLTQTEIRFYSGRSVEKEGGHLVMGADVVDAGTVDLQTPRMGTATVTREAAGLYLTSQSSDGFYPSTAVLEARIVTLGVNSSTDEVRVKGKVKFTSSAGGIDFGHGGILLQRFNAAVVGLSTDSNGNASFAHGLGVTPGAVICTGQNSAGLQVANVSRDATTATVNLRNASGSILANVSRTIHFIAVQ